MTMKLKYTSSISLLVAAIIAGASLPLAAGETSRGGTFLPMGWGARGEGLGGAAAILIKDDRSAYWNPANITFLQSPRVSLGTTKPVPDMDAYYSVFSAGTGLMDNRSKPDAEQAPRKFGVAITATHLGLELAGGSKWNESTLGISVAFAPNHYNSFGLTCRMLKSSADLYDADASGMTFDFGWTALIHDRMWLALVGRNFTSSVSYPYRDETIDPTWNLAAAYERIAGRISVEFDVVMKNSEFNRFLFGTEIEIFKDLLHILGGTDYRITEGERTILHLGVMSIYRSIEISLAFTFDPEDAFGRQTHVSIGYSL